MIIMLAIVCFYFWLTSRSNGAVVVDNIGFNKSDTQYVNVSNSKEIKELKKINTELYDSIRKLNDVTEAIQIKYVTEYKLDTVFSERIVVGTDSIYHYAQKSDTIDYNLDIKGNKIEWFKLDFTLNDSMMIVTRSKGEINETTITHNDNTFIKNVTVYVPKKSLLERAKDKLYFGVV